MEFIDQYAQQIGELLAWISNPDTNVPVIRLLQALAATVGALVTALGFYKAWRYAEKRLGRRLTEFIAQEEQKLALAREAVRQIRGERSAVKPERPKLFSNHELRKALNHVRRRRYAAAETLLQDTLSRTKEREDIARQKTELHAKQSAMAHLLLGAVADSKNDHRTALANFQAALELDAHDAEALEYIGLQLLKLGDSHQALAEFQKLEKIASARGDVLLLAHARRNSGLAHEAPPDPSYFNANISYRDAIAAFPQSGPTIELAHIYELRGRANMKLKNNKQLAHDSLMHALARYSQIEKAGQKDAKDAAQGVKRIHEALAELQQLQNATPPTPEIAAAPPPATALFPISDQKSADQPPGGERPN